MKKLFVLFAFVVGSFLANPAANATPQGRWGAGLSVGSIVSLTAKYWYAEQNAYDLHLGFTGGATILYANHYWHLVNLFGSRTNFAQQLSAYISAGGGVSSWNNRVGCGRWGCEPAVDSGVSMFVRGAFGAEWLPPDPPFGLFAEIAPVITVGPRSGGGLDLQIGGRYYFP